MSFIEPPNPRNPVVDGEQKPLGSLWSGWLVRLVSHLNDLPVYADNAAAVAGGLDVGRFYRTGADPDQVCVVH